MIKIGDRGEFARLLVALEARGGVEVYVVVSVRGGRRRRGAGARTFPGSARESR